MSNLPRPERTSNGRFAPGNRISAAGGHARAAKLPAARRSEIARRAFQAMVQQHFDGDEHLAKARWARIGAYNGDPYNGDPIPRRHHHPGTIAQFKEARRFTLDAVETVEF